MAYGNKTKSSNIFVALKLKFARILAGSFPLNAIRVWALKMCGFKVGQKVYIGTGLLITMPNARSACDLVIGDRVAIAPRVTLILSSDANWSKLNEIIEPVQGKIVLGDDCWLGTGAIVFPNTTIGNMAVVGAGSVVTKDVPSYSMVAGVPAREIKKILP